MKNHKHTKGFTLMELLVAIPMLSFVFLGMAYLLGTTGNFSSVEIAKAKTQTAANNLLMLVKAKGYSKLNEVLPDFNTATTITKQELSTTSPAHPDGITKLLVSMEQKDANASDTVNVTSKICVITVTAPDFMDISTTVKAVSF